MFKRAICTAILVAFTAALTACSGKEVEVQAGDGAPAAGEVTGGPLLPMPVPGEMGPSPSQGAPQAPAPSN